MATNLQKALRADRAFTASYDRLMDYLDACEEEGRIPTAAQKFKAALWGAFLTVGSAMAASGGGRRIGAIYTGMARDLNRAEREIEALSRHRRVRTRRR